MDEWAAKPNLKITIGVRMDRTADPLCLSDCFNRLNEPFLMNGYQAGASIPYNQTIQTGLSHAYPSVDGAVFDPRVGIVWRLQ